jgi:hypothetical protein
MSHLRTDVEYAGAAGVWVLTKPLRRPLVVRIFVAPVSELVFDRLSQEKRLYSASDPPLRIPVGVQAKLTDPFGPRQGSGGGAPRQTRPLPSAAEHPGLHPEGPR